MWFGQTTCLFLFQETIDGATYLESEEDLENLELFRLGDFWCCLNLLWHQLPAGWFRGFAQDAADGKDSRSFGFSHRARGSQHEWASPKGEEDFELKVYQNPVLLFPLSKGGREKG